MTRSILRIEFYLPNFEINLRSMQFVFTLTKLIEFGVV